MDNTDEIEMFSPEEMHVKCNCPQQSKKIRIRRTIAMNRTFCYIIWMRLLRSAFVIPVGINFVHPHGIEP